MFMNKVTVSQTSCITLSSQIFTTTRRYGKHSVIVPHNSKFTTVHRRVTLR